MILFNCFIYVLYIRAYIGYTCVLVYVPYRVMQWPTGASIPPNLGTKLGAFPLPSSSHSLPPLPGAF